MERDGIEYRYIGYRIPQRGDLYLNKLDKVVRCKKQNYSRRAKSKPIVEKVHVENTHEDTGLPG